jgi:hypothetical protein
VRQRSGPAATPARSHTDLSEVDQIVAGPAADADDDLTAWSIRPDDEDDDPGAWWLYEMAVIAEGMDSLEAIGRHLLAEHGPDYPTVKQIDALLLDRALALIEYQREVKAFEAAAGPPDRWQP